jgi:hypothetical protein
MKNLILETIQTIHLDKLENRISPNYAVHSEVRYKIAQLFEHEYQKLKENGTIKTGRTQHSEYCILDGVASDYI